MTRKHQGLVGGAVACLTPMSAAVSLTLSAGPLLAQSLPKDLAFPGYSGFLNVPSATVLNVGQADVQWSDQAFLQGRPGFEKGRYGHFNNVSGGFGIFPNVEVGGRLVWDKTQTNCYTRGCTIRDLSANIKIQAPYIPENWFTLAAGVQDLGGETDDFEAAYVVAGRQFGPVELAVGYGRPKETPRYLDGAFGAISYRPVPWLSVMAEHDSLDARIGLGASTPEGWLPHGLKVKAKVLAWDEGDTDNDRNFVSIGLSMPFGNSGSKRRLESMPAIDETIKPSSPEPSNTESAGVEVAADLDANQQARAVGKALVRAGYERVRTANVNGTLKVEWENNLYNRDERDSIWDVAQTVHAMSEPFDRAELTLLNQGLAVRTQHVALREAQPYKLSSGYAGGDTPKDLLEGSGEAVWDYEGSYGPSWKPRLTLSPSISSGVATEYGVWDASVALSSELTTNLWPGALASARYDAEIYQTDDYKRGGVFYNSRQRTDLVEAEVQQTIKLHSQLYTSFHAGRYAINYDGVFNETLLMSPGGRHAVGFLAGNFAHADDSRPDNTQALAQYSYYNPSLDAQFTVYGGQFFAEDTGVRVDSRFWFGDYALTLQYKNTDAEFVRSYGDFWCMEAG